VTALDDELAADFGALPAEVEGLIDRAELTQALEVVWQRVRRLNRYVEERTPWELAKDDARARELDQVLSSLVAGLTVLAVLLHAYLPASMGLLLDALGIEQRTLASARWGEAAPLGRPIEHVESLFPKDTQPATA
jgi:methionyl-tRNA synthetase